MRVSLSIGVKDWAEIIGIMTEKESQGDEEILIYAMTLINKVCVMGIHVHVCSELSCYDCKASLS